MNRLLSLLFIAVVSFAALPARAAPYADVDWDRLIDAATSIADRSAANQEITRAHHELSLGLRAVVGAEAGANFHTWAVWGSFKAGESIRGEDVPYVQQAARNIRDGYPCGLGGWSLLVPSCALSRVAQAELDGVSVEISRGNRLVLDDIGKVSGRFIRAFGASDARDPAAFQRFIDGVPDELLKKAFTQYWRAKYEPVLKSKQELMLLGNLYAILHEHTLLQPIIARAIPALLGIFTTEFLLKFRIGDETLDVSRDVPLYAPNGSVYPPSLRQLDNPELVAFYDQWNHSIETFGSGAADWSILSERMNFICSLFRTRHLKPELFEMP